MEDEPTEIRGATGDELEVIRQAQLAAMRVANLALAGEDIGELREAIRLGRARLFVEFEPATGGVVISAEWPAMQPGRLELKAIVPRRRRTDA